MLLLLLAARIATSRADEAFSHDQHAVYSIVHQSVQQDGRTMATNTKQLTRSKPQKKSITSSASDIGLVRFRSKSIGRKSKSVTYRFVSTIQIRQTTMTRVLCSEKYCKISNKLLPSQASFPFTITRRKTNHQVGPVKLSVSSCPSNVERVENINKDSG